MYFIQKEDTPIGPIDQSQFIASGSGKTALFMPKQGGIEKLGIMSIVGTVKDNKLFTGYFSRFDGKIKHFLRQVAFTGACFPNN